MAKHAVICDAESMIALLKDGDIEQQGNEDLLLLIKHGARRFTGPWGVEYLLWRPGEQHCWVEDCTDSRVSEIREWVQDLLMQ